ALPPPRNVPLQVVAGDPKNGGPLVGSTSIERPVPLSETSVQIPIATAKLEGDVDLWVVVDRLEKIMETSDLDNRRLLRTHFTAQPRDVVVRGFSNAFGDPNDLGFFTSADGLVLTYEVVGYAAGPFAFGFFTSADARLDAADTEVGTRLPVASPADLAVGLHTLHLAGSSLAPFLIDTHVPFVLAVADVGKQV